MITVQNMATAAERHRLNELIERWPRGMAVRHVNGWTGTVADDVPGNVHGIDVPETAFTSHALTGTRPADAAICVAWTTVDGIPATAWYRTAVLSPVGKDVPAAPKPAPKPTTSAPRKRTWRNS